jgi:hypothetical protein
MSTKLCQETNLDEAIEDPSLEGERESTLTGQVLNDMDGYKKEDTVSVTQFGQEDFPDGGLRAWLIVAGVRGNSAYLKVEDANAMIIIGCIYDLFYVSR